MSESQIETTSISGQTVYSKGSTAFLKYYDTGSEKWERWSGSDGIPFINVCCGSIGVTGSSNEGMVESNNSWYDISLDVNKGVTGSWVDVGDWSCLSILVVPTQSGSMDVQHSMDGVKVDRHFPFSIMPTGSFFAWSPRAKYFRVVYVNDGVSGSLSLQTLMYKRDKLNVYEPLATAFYDTTIVSPVKAAIAGKSSKGGGEYVDVKVNPSGTLETNDTIATVEVTLPVTGSVSLVDSSGSYINNNSGFLHVTNLPYTYFLSKGIVSESMAFNKIGFNGDVDNLEEDLWPTGGKYVFPTVTGSMFVQSSSDLDKTGSTGIQSIRLQYLDSNYTCKYENISLNGTTRVETVAKDIFRVNAIRALSVGSNGFAVGNVTVSGSNDSNIYRSILIGNTRGRSLIYTVPTGSTLYITELNVGTSNASSGHYVMFRGRGNYEDTLGSKINFMQLWFEIGLQDETLHIPFSVPIKVPETTDIVMSVLGDGVSANSICFGAVRGWLTNA